MASDAPYTARQGRSRRAFFVTTMIGVVVVAAAAAAFAFTSGTRAVTVHALSLHQADDTFRVATVARFQLGFAAHLAALDREFGSDFTDTRDQSIAEASEALRQIEVGVEDLLRLGASAELTDATRNYATTARSVMTALQSGDSVEGQRIVEAELPSAFEAVADLLIGERESQLDAVTRTDRATATWGNITRFLLAVVIPLIMIVVYREIARRQQRQAELEIRLDAERQLSKAREDFIANASHELRTPLTSIYGIAQLLREEPDMPPTADEMVDIINSEASDLSRMVEDLLTTARLAAGQLRFEPEHVDVELEADQIVGPFLRSGADITVDIAPGIVNVDRLRQVQVLRNLVSNATKYGGPRIFLRGQVDGDWYVWIVADDGEGVPPELEDRLFQRFIHQHSFQQAVAGGVGLGLSIVKSLAEGMGGNVSYEKTPGEARFIVRVPLAVEEVSAVEAGGWVELPEEGAA